MSIIAISNREFAEGHKAGSIKAETNERVEAVERVLASHAVEILSAKPMNLGKLVDLRVHSFEHLKHLRETELAAIRSGEQVEAGSYAKMAEGTLMAANTMMSASLDGAELLINGRHSVVYVVGRSPGHHADDIKLGKEFDPNFKTPGPMGWCFLSNVGAAARWLEARGHKVGIVDIDAHMGNGTQLAIAKRPYESTANISMVDIYITHPNYFYPELEATEGAEAYVMADFVENAPNIRRFPLQTLSPTNFGNALSEGLGWLKEIGVDLCLVSFGVDCMEGDAVGGGKLKKKHIDAALADIFKASKLKKTLVVMEGGYRLENLRRGATAVVEQARALDSQ